MPTPDRTDRKTAVRRALEPARILTISIVSRRERVMVIALARSSRRRRLLTGAGRSRARR